MRNAAIHSFTKTLNLLVQLVTRSVRMAQDLMFHIRPRSVSSFKWFRSLDWPFCQPSSLLSTPPTPSTTQASGCTYQPAHTRNPSHRRKKPWLQRWICMKMGRSFVTTQRVTFNFRKTMEVFPWNNHPTSWAAPRAAIRGGASGSHFQILQLMLRKIWQLERRGRKSMESWYETWKKLL